MGLRPKPHQVRSAASRDGPSPWTSEFGGPSVVRGGFRRAMTV